MTKKILFRQAVHDLINRASRSLAPIGIDAEMLETLLKEKSFAPEDKEFLASLVSDLRLFKKDTETACEMIEQIRTFVYSKIDPDQTEIGITIADKPLE